VSALWEPSPYRLVAGVSGMQDNFTTYRDDMTQAHKGSSGPVTAQASNEPFEPLLPKHILG
jgi:hypothetical protein